MVVFTVAVGSAVARGINITCGCFGAGSGPVTLAHRAPRRRAPRRERRAPPPRRPTPPRAAPPPTRRARPRAARPPDGAGHGAPAQAPRRSAPRLLVPARHTVASLEHRLMLDVGPDGARPAPRARLAALRPRLLPPGVPRVQRVRAHAPRRSPSSPRRKSQRRARRKAEGLRVMVGPPRGRRRAPRALPPLARRPRGGARVVALRARRARVRAPVRLPPPLRARGRVPRRRGRRAARRRGHLRRGAAGVEPRLLLLRSRRTPSARSGVANVVVGVEIAAAAGHPLRVPGLPVAACPSLRYKAAFGPREELRGWPRARRRRRAG